MSKPRIACDIDEVLVDFLGSLIAFHNDTYGTSLTPENFNSYQFHNVWGGTVEDCNRKMQLFFESPHFLEGMRPLPAALDCLQSLKEKFELHVVTARQNKLQDVTRAWIQKHYPDIFEELHFGNHYATEGVARTKASMCAEINAILLIDDSFHYAVECAQAGIPVILFGDYAWNRSGDVSHLNQDRDLVVRVSTWAETVHQVHRISAEITDRR